MIFTELDDPAPRTPGPSQRRAVAERAGRLGRQRRLRVGLAIGAVVVLAVSAGSTFHVGTAKVNIVSPVGERWAAFCRTATQIGMLIHGPIPRSGMATRDALAHEYDAYLAASAPDPTVRADFRLSIPYLGLGVNKANATELAALYRINRVLDVRCGLDTTIWGFVVGTPSSPGGSAP